MSETTILFVCTGNICRSAMAERMLRSRIPDSDAHRVVSAGVSDEETGRSMDPRAARLLASRGIDASGHIAQQVTVEMLEAADIAVAMTTGHRAALERLVARMDAANRPEIRMLRDFDPGFDPTCDDVDVADPWYGDDEDFEQTWDDLAGAMDGLAAALGCGG